MRWRPWPAGSAGSLRNARSPIVRHLSWKLSVGFAAAAEGFATDGLRGTAFAAGFFAVGFFAGAGGLLAWRGRRAGGSSKRSEKRRGSSRRDDDDLDALLNGGSAGGGAPAAAEEQFPTSRGLLGSRRPGMR